MRYQFGLDLYFFIFWRDVDAAKFCDAVAPFLLLPGQSIAPIELALLLTGDFAIYRKGWRLYRALKRTVPEPEQVAVKSLETKA